MGLERPIEDDNRLASAYLLDVVSEYLLTKIEVTTYLLRKIVVFQSRLEF